ncbi:XdhC family protein [Paraglaciecola sp.]|uniref:XdhC family protein n=1 Tax=Paraglaciecola sp. TaxID=1920173 RepID=UPI0030F483E5
MSNRIDNLLAQWLETKDQLQWVLATIISTEGSSYRKAGAMMMINGAGQYFGLLSGGCLESDIMRQARRCWDDGRNRIIKYDMREEEDLAWQLGIGCGGMVEILLQPVNQANDYLYLEALDQQLKCNRAAGYKQNITQALPANQLITEPSQIRQLTTGKQGEGDSASFYHIIEPAPCIAVFGGGVDARPVVAIAAELGWQVILCDSRMAYAREGYFNGAQSIYRQPFGELSSASWLPTLDAALVLTHNVKLDGEALKLLQYSNVKYVGLLGPLHRTERVMQSADLLAESLNFKLANPVGLRLGGELPESIALSMLAEVHAFLEKTDALSISQVLD